MESRTFRDNILSTSRELKFNSKIALPIESDTLSRVTLSGFSRVKSIDASGYRHFGASQNSLSSGSSSSTGVSNNRTYSPTSDALPHRAPSHNIYAVSVDSNSLSQSDFRPKLKWYESNISKLIGLFAVGTMFLVLVVVAVLIRVESKDSSTRLVVVESANPNSPRPNTRTTSEQNADNSASSTMNKRSTSDSDQSIRSNHTNHLGVNVHSLLQTSAMRSDLTGFVDPLASTDNFIQVPIQVVFDSKLLSRDGDREQQQNNRSTEENTEPNSHTGTNVKRRKKSSSTSSSKNLYVVEMDIKIRKNVD